MSRFNNLRISEIDDTRHESGCNCGLADGSDDICKDCDCSEELKKLNYAFRKTIEGVLGDIEVIDCRTDADKALFDQKEQEYQVAKITSHEAWKKAVNKDIQIIESLVLTILEMNKDGFKLMKCEADFEKLIDSLVRDQFVISTIYQSGSIQDMLKYNILTERNVDGICDFINFDLYIWDYSEKEYRGMFNILAEFADAMLGK